MQLPYLLLITSEARYTFFFYIAATAVFAVAVLSAGRARRQVTVWWLLTAAI